MLTWITTVLGARVTEVAPSYNGSMYVGTNINTKDGCTGKFEERANLAFQGAKKPLIVLPIELWRLHANGA